MCSSAKSSTPPLGRNTNAKSSFSSSASTPARRSCAKCFSSGSMRRRDAMRSCSATGSAAAQPTGWRPGTARLSCRAATTAAAILLGSPETVRGAVPRHAEHAVQLGRLYRTRGILLCGRRNDVRRQLCRFGRAVRRGQRPLYLRGDAPEARRGVPAGLLYFDAGNSLRRSAREVPCQGGGGGAGRSAGSTAISG